MYVIAIGKRCVKCLFRYYLWRFGGFLDKKERLCVKKLTNFEILWTKKVFSVLFWKHLETESKGFY